MRPLVSASDPLGGLTSGLSDVDIAPDVSVSVGQYLERGDRAPVAYLCKEKSGLKSYPFLLVRQLLNKPRDEPCVPQLGQGVTDGLLHVAGRIIEQGEERVASAGVADLPKRPCSTVADPPVFVGERVEKWVDCSGMS